MRKWLQATLLTSGVILVAIQIVRPSRNNPLEQAGHNIHTVAAVDPTVDSILQRSCNDCHSYSTVWPWYSHVAPVSWLVAADVHRGRQALNLSEWSGYTPHQQAEMLRDMCEEASQGEMPGALYTTMHRQAQLNNADRQQFCDWVRRVAGGNNQTEQQNWRADPPEND